MPAVLRRLVVPVYLPWFASTLSMGMLLPVLPLYLRNQGLSYGATSTVLAAAGLGAALAGIPAGGLLARIGERRTLVISMLLGSAGAVLSGSTTSAALLFVLQFTIGVGSILVRLACQTHVARSVATTSRGRALSTMGGTARFAVFLGPLAGGFCAEQFGFTTAFVLAGGVAALGIVPSSAPRIEPLPSVEIDADRSPGLVDALRVHRRLLLRAGLGPMLVAAVRGGRLVVLPLIGESLDMSPGQVGILLGVSTGADLLLFPVSGVLMDHFGRLKAVVPAFSLMAIGLLALSVAGSSTAVMTAGVVIGVGNGLSAGTMLTIASDLAPPDAPAQFMAAFGTMTDLGRIVGPLIVGGVGDALGLEMSALVLAIAMLVGIVAMVTMIGETRAHA